MLPASLSEGGGEQPQRRAPKRGGEGRPGELLRLVRGRSYTEDSAYHKQAPAPPRPTPLARRREHTVPGLAWAGAMAWLCSAHDITHRGVNCSPYLI